MIESYRADYPGEFVVVNTKWSGGKKDQQREWIPNPIENQHISGRAVCIGSDTDLGRFNYSVLQRHRGGLLGSKKVQTYSIGSVAQEMRLDFAVENSPEKLNELIASQYAENNVVYTSARNCIAHPGSFYLIPRNPLLINFVTPVYLAAFDSHKEIFLLGYTKDHPETNLRWRQQLADVINTYKGTKFFAIGEPSNMPDEILSCSNLETMNYHEWVSYADV